LTAASVFVESSEGGCATNAPMNTCSPACMRLAGASRSGAAT